MAFVRSAFDELASGGFLAWTYLNPWNGRYWHDEYWD